MLVFFIHGVAESKVQFAQPLKHLIKDELLKRNQTLPYFHSGFYADVLNKKDKMWNFITEDLEIFKQENPKDDIQHIFRGQELRQEFISDFVGDAFTYLNLERGAKIRESIAGHLEDFILNHPEEKELHIIAHSMGTVILWDILFSDKFKAGDAALKIRSLINEQVKLKSITTMGSPVLLFNMILDVTPEQVKNFTIEYHQQPLRWTNIIHSSDLIAYPISSSLKITDESNLSVKDKFISTQANDLEKTIRAVAESPAIEATSKINARISQAFSFAALVAGAADAHVNYWNCSQTAKIIVDNFLGDEEKIIDIVIARLKKVPGITITLLKDMESAQTIDPNMQKQWEKYFSTIDKLTEDFQFFDGTGKLRMRDNLAQVPHVSVYNHIGGCQFRGYVGLIHAHSLREEVKAIKHKYV